MKRTILIVITFLLLLPTSCSTTPKAPKPLQNLHPEDRIQANLQENFVETEDGCYYLCVTLSNEKIIYFSPRGSTAFYPLCSKPNCTHHDENCDAWCSCALGYYDGALYGVTINNQEGGRFELVKMDPDGTNHTVLKHWIPEHGGAFRFYFHHGALYIHDLEDLDLPPEEQGDRLFVMDLHSYEQTEIFADLFHTGDQFRLLNCFENKLYVLAQNDQATSIHWRVLELDAASETYQELASFQLGIAYATESTFYYLEPDVGFRECDLATGETKDCGLPVEDAWWAAYDEDYIYLMGHPRNNEQEHTLYFLNRNYEYLGQVELTDGVFYAYVSSDKLYLGKAYEPLTYYINKSDIGSHELSLQPLDRN